MTGTDTTHIDPRSGTRTEPEPIRFFGTTWVRRDSGYALRRAALAAGSLAAAAAGVLVLVLGFQGLADAHVGPTILVLGVSGFAACSVLAFHRAWASFTRRRSPFADPEAAKGVYAIGFVGTLLAYGVRSVVEAPGERLRRAEYEERRPDAGGADAGPAGEARRAQET